MDVISGTHYSPDLAISAEGYTLLKNKAKEAQKPLGMAEYGSSVWQWDGGHKVLPSSPLTFDATQFARLLTDYPEVAYWVSWHSYEDGDKVVRLSLSDSLKTDELFSTPGIYSIENPPPSE